MLRDTNLFYQVIIWSFLYIYGWSNAQTKLLCENEIKKKHNYCEILGKINQSNDLSAVNQKINARQMHDKGNLKDTALQFQFHFLTRDLLARKR